MNDQLQAYTILCCCLCIPALLALAAALYPLTHLSKARSAARLLAEKTNLVALNPKQSGVHVWYGGIYDSRRIAIRVRGRTQRYYSDGRSRISVSWGMYVVMECRVPEPVDITVKRDRENAAAPQTFEEAFSHKNGDLLSQKAQAAMLAFAQYVYPFRLREGTLKLTRRGRTLRLSDRETLEDMLGPEVLPDAKLILLHDFPYLGLTVDELTTLLHEMSGVCAAIET